MKRSKYYKIFPLISFIIFLLLTQGRSGAEEKLMILCGAAFKLPIEEITEQFKKSHSINVRVTYGAVPTILAQLELTRRGDVLIAPTEDLIEKGIKKNLIADDSVKNIAYLVPCINVQRGNPKNIRSLKDLTRSGIRIAIANPKFVYIGMIAETIVNKNLSMEEKENFNKNLVMQAEDFNKMATLLVLKHTDAIIGFHFLEYWYPQNIETIRLKIQELPRIGYSQAGIISYSQSKEQAQKFVNYLISEEAKTVFRKYNYFCSETETYKWIESGNK